METTVKNTMRNLMPDSHLQNGLSYIIAILNKLDEWLEEFSVEKKHQIIYRGITRIYESEFIRSGASIRLKGSHSPRYSFSDYIAYHQNLIRQVKDNYPEAYKNWNDLEILADLQHNGAATCLVDFSKNVLVSLWFACNDKTAENSSKITLFPDLHDLIKTKCTYKQNDDDNGDIKQNYGVLYCYNITYDLLYENNLSFVTNHDIKKDIADLLLQTKKITNFCSNTEYAFMLWEPAILNNRISRQDSVFLFGLNRFVIKKHRILQIYIHNSIKKSILDALNRFFNISATTIFNDKQGFATVNDKFTQIHHWNSREDVYAMGVSEMLSGDYKVALDFFIESEIDNNYFVMYCEDRHDELDKVSIDELIKRGEVYLSKAICYKNIILNESDFLYYEQVVEEYRKAKVMFSMLLKKIPIKMREYELGKMQQESYIRKYKRYSRKLLRIYNDIINLMYDAEDYSQCICFCKEAIDDIMTIKEGESALRDTQNEFKLDENYSSVYCNIAIMELLVLLFLKTMEISPENLLKWKDWWSENEKQVNKDINGYQPFDQLLVLLLNLLYYYVLKTRKITETVKDEDIKCYEKKFIAGLDSFREQISIERQYVTDYSTWDFGDLLNAIKASSFSPENKKELMTWILDVVQVRDWFVINNLNRISEMDA